MSCFHTINAYRVYDKDGESSIKFNRPKNSYYEELKLPCGKCIGCKLDHANEWAVRCWAESLNWKNNCFITLTYNNDNLPRRGLLHKPDIQKFMKRLRYYHNGIEWWTNPQNGKYEQPIRYLLCGEYGPSENGTHRPHYHILIFNWKPKNLTFYKWNKDGEPIYTCKEIQKIWKKGFITVEDLNYRTACYVARYTDKKLFTKENKEIARKNKLQPEFIEMSRNGGIGLKYWNEYQNEILDKEGIYIKIGDKVKNKPIPKYFERKYKEKITEKEWEKYSRKKQNKAIKTMQEILSKTDKTESEYMAMKEKNLLEKAKMLRRDNFV